MSKKLKFFAMMLTCILLSISHLSAGENTYTMKTSGSASTAIETNWTANVSASFDATYGAYFSCNAASKTFTATSGANITGTITKVQVTGRRNKNMSYTIDCTVGGSALGSQYVHGATSGNYDTDDTFYNSTGLTGTIVVTAVCTGHASTTSKKGSFFFTSITVTTATGSTYTLTFLEHDGGGTASGSPSTGSVSANATSFSYGATAPSKTGYKVEGFYTNTLASSGVKVANSSREFVASVGGWTNGSSQYTKGANANLYIKWQAKQAAITFDKNGGSGGVDGTTATYGSAMTTVTVPTRTGYNFAGYYDAETNNDGSGNKYYNADGTSAANWNKDTEAATTLYAKWTRKTPTVGDVSGEWAYGEGMTIALSVSPTDIAADATYQWKKYNSGTSSWDNLSNDSRISGATSASLSITNSATSDAGQYKCTVNNGGQTADSNTPTIKVFNVQFYNNGTTYGAFTIADRTAHTLTGYMNLAYESAQYGFKINDNATELLGNTGYISSDVSGWTFSNTSDCHINTTFADAYTFVWHYDTYKLDVTYPVHEQTAGKTIYLDNDVRKWSNAYYRIGHPTYSEATAMTKVHGTANLYKHTTVGTWSGFYAWHLANNQSGTGSSESIYNLDGGGKAITEGVDYQKYVVTSDITLTPTTKNRDEDGAALYNVTSTPGMKTDNVEISSYSHGTVTVTYDDYDGTDNKTMTTGNRDLAHTVILKSVTAVANDGYELTALTINGDDHTSGDSYTVTGATTITATFTAIDYTISFNQNGGEGGQTSSKTAHYGEAMPTTITCPTKDGYDFDGYWDGEGGTGTQYYTSTGASARNWDKTSNATLYAKWNVKGYTLTWVLGDGVVKTAGTGAAVVDATGTVSSSVPFGTALTAPVVERDGYTFTGWAEGSVASTMPSSATTYTAEWSINSYDVHWFVNGSADGVTQGGTLVEYNSRAAYPASNPSVPAGCSGKKFVGWRASTIDGVSATDPGGIFKSSAASPPIVAETWFHAVFADGDLEEDVIDYDATSSTLASESTTAYHSDFNISGSSTDATYTIYSMGTGDDVALRWNKNGYLYTNTPPTSGVNVNSITITTTADKNITIYYDYRNSAYQSSSTVTATSSGYTFDMPGDYNDIQIHGTTSSTVVSSIVITYGSFSNYTTSCGTQYTITLKEGNDSPTGSASGTSNGTAKVVSNGTALFNFTGTSAPTGYEVEGYYKENTLTTKVAASDGTLQNGGGSGIAGWTNSSGQFIGDDDDPLYIKWQAKNITITWNVNGAGGTVTPTSSSYTYNGSTVALPTPTRSGYWFDGWYTDPSSGSQITEIGTTNKPSSDVTYYAHWTSKTYTDYRTFCVEEYDITLHDNNGGSNNGSAKVTTNGTSLTTIVAPTRAGYEVDYYKTAADGVKVAEADGTLVGPVTDWTNSSHEYTKGDDATMYAHWKYAQYDIAYYDKNSAAFSGVHEVGYPTKHTYNTATILDSPTRAGYTFDGWYTVADCSSGKVTSLGATAYTSGPINLYANWTQNNWALTMASSVGGGAGTSTSDAAITAPTTGAGTVENKHYGDEITVTVSTPSHHTFTGWTSSNGGSFANASLTTTTFTMPDNATTVTANFTEDTKYTVTWYDNGDGSNTEQVYSGETTTFPDLSADCDMYKAAGWIAVSNPATEFTSETMDKPAATIYAAGATTSAITGNVTYKAVYRHKYYTNDAFVNGTTDGEAYYLYATYSGDKYYKCNSAPDLTTSTDKANAKPVYLEKVGGSYYIREVATDKYFYGNSGSLAVSDDKSATDAYKWTFSTPSCSPDTKGDYKIVNEADKASKTLLFNSGSGKYIKEYSNTNDCAANYYNFSLEKAYYYKYSPTAACYDITVSTNGWERATWETLDGSHKLQGTQLTVTPACGYHITSVSITNGTFTPASGYDTHDPVTFTIVPTGTCTFTVNFNITPNDNDKYTISYLDGATTLPQTKTDAVKACGSVTLPNGYSTASGAGGTCSGWTFDGWTKTAYTFGQMSEPSDIEDAGSSQTVSGDQTWYAVYHKTFAAGDYFYLMYGANYVTSFNSSAHKFVANETTTTNALLFAMENNYLYYLDPSTRRKMWVYADGNTVDVTATETKPSSTAYQTTMTLVSGTYQITNGNNRYLSASGTDVKYYSGTSNTHATKPDASSFIAYYPKTDCAVETATITFNPGAGNTCALSTVVAEIGSTISLPVAADVSGYDADWTFYGWSPTEVTNIGTAAPGILYTGGASYTVTADATLYAIYTQTPPDGNFDNTSGGKYKIWAIKNGIYYYATSNGMTRGKLGVTTDCSEGALFELIRNDVTGGYKIHINGENKYLKGAGNDDTDFDYVLYASAPEWTITDVHSTSPNGYWRISSGIQSRGIVFGHTNFGHYDATQIANSPTMWFDVYIGQCADDYYTSNPNKSLSLTGDIRITSTNGQSVRSASSIAVKGSLLSGSTISASSSNSHFAATFASNVITDGGVNTTMTVTYTPAEYATTESAIITVTAEDKSQQIEVYGRSLPQNFVIAVKSGEQWYALPDDKTTSDIVKAVPIEVNDPNAPTAASRVPHNTEWRLSDVVNSDNRPKDKVYFYEPNKMKDDGVTPWHYALYAGTAPSIGTYGQVSGISGSSSPGYEWGLTTSDLCAYTIGNANVGKDISINTAGNFGTHASGIVSSTLYLLPITAYYETAAMQVLEWKANSVVVMYTGTQTTATTKVGNEDASSAQTLSSQKLTHGIYELTTGQALTANAGAALKVSFGGGTEMAIVTIPIIINSDVTADADHASEDVIIVSGGKLTAAATKYSYRNVYVYGGGKLKIASGSQLGVNNIILRAGGITTSGIGSSPSATYEYIYPQVELGGTLTSTQTNIKYEYITDYDHWYQLCLPFDGTLSSITYPQEYYGDNVTADNHGSWEIDRYAGEIRATGSYDAWKNTELESATTVTAGHGYLYFGAPKKITIGGDKQRQKWGIQRITMPVTAATATSAETADKNISVDSYADVATSTKPNDQGWNLVGNPYMVNLTDFSSESLIAGQLVHTETTPWDGKWRNDGTGVRYVTIPDYHFNTYEAKTASVAAAAGDFMPGRAFFVQIDEGASTLTFDVDNRAALMPALYAKTEQSVDIETGIVMSNESKHDEVNFWIKDGKTAEYEYNADYPKTMNNTNFNIYGVHSHGELSWVAISPEIAEGSMAIGYQVPAAGEYTLSLSETYISDKIDALFVTDHAMSPEVTVDLMDDPYVFTVMQAETNDTRFTVSIRLKEESPGTATDTEQIDTKSQQPQKFIYHEKMYILRGGVIYDATGKRVREINK